MDRQELLICDCSHCRNIKKQQKQLELLRKNSMSKVLKDSPSPYPR